jgi:hypothetical protein
MKTTAVTKTGRCNTYSLIWAAIYGCTGEGKLSGTQPGNFGRPIAHFTCDTCRAQQALDKASPRDKSERMRAAMKAAGVVEYRNARAEVQGGRPVVTHPGRAQ